MSRDVTPAALTPSSGLPLLPARAHPDLPRSRPGRARRHWDAPDAVAFYAKCPGCGITAKWHEKRVNTGVDITIDCRICARRDRMRLAATA